MYEGVRIIIPVGLISIAILILYTNRKAKTFEASHQSGLYKTKIIIKVLEYLFRIAFAAAALLTLYNIISPVTGIILIAATFLCWLPLQTLFCTKLSLDEQGITYMNPLRRKVEIPWQSVVSVSVSASGILIKGGDEVIKVRSYFTGYERIEEIIKENCPKA